jgi:hypothetical protein
MIRHPFRHPVFVATLIAAALLWAPPPYASVRPEHRAILALGAGLALLLAMLVEDAARPLRLAAPVAAAVAGIGLLGVLQSLPWPEGAVELLSREHARLAALAGADAHLSLAPSVSRTTALWWLAVSAALLAAAVAGRHRRERRILLVALALSGCFQVLYGAQLWLRGSSEIWHVEVPGLAGRLRGSFVNSNHLAFYLGLLLPVAFAWGWRALEHGRRHAEPLDRRVLRLVPPVLVWLVLFLGLAFSQSRAGLIAALGAVSAQGLLLAAVRRRWTAAPVGLVAGTAGVAVVAAVGLQQGLGRLLASSPDELDFQGRLQAYGAGLRIALRFPLAGCGLGAVREAFDLERPPGLHSTWGHLHNDWLELLATTGVLGAGIAILGLVVLLRRLAEVLQHGARGEDRAAGLAALGALCAAVVHSMFDFSLAVPANALTLAVLVGASVSPPVPLQREDGVIEVRRGDVRVLERPARRRRRRARGGGDRPAPPSTP